LVYIYIYFFLILIFYGREGQVPGLVPPPGDDGSTPYIEGAVCFETLVTIYQTTRLHIQEDSSLQTEAADV
jgi:hypothetical protein